MSRWAVWGAVCVLGVLLLLSVAAASGDDAADSATSASAERVEAAGTSVESGSGSGVPSSVRLPPAGAAADYQLGGAYPPAPRTRIVSRDRQDPPAPGAYGVCYVNAFQTQPQELGWWREQHPGLLLRVRGREVIDADWPDEVLLDTSTAAHREALAEVVGGWIEGCASSGYDAVELDNLDAWTRSRGLLDVDATTAMARLLTGRAHRAGLAVAQKNTAELASRGRSLGFDFAVVEQCQVYDECEAYTAEYGARVVEVEYDQRAFDAACSARGGQVSILLRDRELLPRGARGHVFRSC